MVHAQSIVCNSRPTTSPVGNNDNNVNNNMQQIASVQDVQVRRLNEVAAGGIDRVANVFGASLYVSQGVDDETASHVALVLASVFDNAPAGGDGVADSKPVAEALANKRAAISLIADGEDPCALACEGTVVVRASEVRPQWLADMASGGREDAAWTAALALWAEAASSAYPSGFGAVIAQEQLGAETNGKYTSAKGTCAGGSNASWFAARAVLTLLGAYASPQSCAAVASTWGACTPADLGGMTIATLAHPLYSSPRLLPGYPLAYRPTLPPSPPPVVMTTTTTTTTTRLGIPSPPPSPPLLPPTAPPPIGIEKQLETTTTTTIVGDEGPSKSLEAVTEKESPPPPSLGELAQLFEGRIPPPPPSPPPPAAQDVASAAGGGAEGGLPPVPPSPPPSPPRKSGVEDGLTTNSRDQQLDVQSNSSGGTASSSSDIGVLVGSVVAGVVVIAVAGIILGWRWKQRRSRSRIQGDDHGGGGGAQVEDAATEGVSKGEKAVSVYPDV